MGPSNAFIRNGRSGTISRRRLGSNSAVPFQGRREERWQAVERERSLRSPCGSAFSLSLRRDGRSKNGSSDDLVAGVSGRSAQYADLLLHLFPPGLIARAYAGRDEKCAVRLAEHAGEALY